MGRLNPTHFCLVHLVGSYYTHRRVWRKARRGIKAGNTEYSTHGEHISVVTWLHSGLFSWSPEKVCSEWALLFPLVSFSEFLKINISDPKRRQFLDLVISAINLPEEGIITNHTWVHRAKCTYPYLKYREFSHIHNLCFYSRHTDLYIDKKHTSMVTTFESRIWWQQGNHLNISLILGDRQTTLGGWLGR